MNQSGENFTRAIVVAVMMCLLVGCGTKVTLMPTPVLYQDGRVDLYKDLPADLQTSNLDVFYATDRSPKGAADNREYSNGVEQQLRLGKATVQFGENENWDDLVKTSVANPREKDLVLKPTRAVEMGVLSSGRNFADATQLSAGERAFADAINQALGRVIQKEICIYVQGFRDDFDGSVAVAAELRHYLGRRQVVVAYAWPCRQRLINYTGDVNRAKKSAPNLARLIEFLAAQTHAEHINVLGYSAGATLVVDGMVALRRNHLDLDEKGLQERLRVGNVVLAAADVDARHFVKNQLVSVTAIPKYVAITISENDKAMGMAAKLRGGSSRLGRPDIDDLTPAEVEDVAKQTKLYAIDVSAVKGPHSESQGIGGHGYWYTNPWVSSDILCTLVWQVPPDQRGLVRIPGRFGWTFPDDYPDRVHEIVSKQVELLRTKNAAPTSTPSISRGMP